MFKKIVSNQISPHFRGKDALFMLASLVLPHKSPVLLPDTGNFATIYTNSARTALKLWILGQNFSENQKKVVGIPAFCCAVMAVPFLSEGFEVLWLETDENGLLDVKSAEKHAEKMTVLLIPHIFGQVAPVTQICSAVRAKNANIKVISDCAHAFSPFLDEVDASIYSFGREKVVSTVSGGALVVRKAEKQQYMGRLESPALKWTLQHAFQPVILHLVRVFWPYGKIFGFLGRKLGILPVAVSALEKKGRTSMPFAAFPKVFYRVLAWQMNLKPKKDVHAQKIAQKWKKVLTKFLPDARIVVPEGAFRVIVFDKNARKIKNWAKKHDFDLKDWEGEPISPPLSNMEDDFGYTMGQCPVAEDVARKIVTFPTNWHVKLADCERFATMVRNFYV